MIGKSTNSTEYSIQAIWDLIQWREAMQDSSEKISKCQKCFIKNVWLNFGTYLCKMTLPWTWDTLIEFSPQYFGYIHTWEFLYLCTSKFMNPICSPFFLYKKMENATKKHADAYMNFAIWNQPCFSFSFILFLIFQYCGYKLNQSERRKMFPARLFWFRLKI